MITKTINFRITGGEAPYAYSYIISDTCISVDAISGTANNQGGVYYIESEFKFADTACLTAADVKVEIKDNQGCVSIQQVEFINDCDISILNITPSGNYTFKVNILGGCDNNISWDYDTTVFNPINTNGNTITLELINPFTRTTTISVIVDDCNGCSDSATLTYTICRPTAKDISLVLGCGTYTGTSACQVYSFSNNGLLETINNCNSDIDWDSVEITLPTTGSGAFCSEYSNRRLSLQATEDVTRGSYVGSWRVKTKSGAYSTVGSIFATVQACNPDYFVIEPISYSVPCPTVVGQVISIPLVNSIPGGRDIDWSTLVIGASALGSPLIEILFDVFGDPILRYTIPALTGTDTFSFIVQDTDGNSSTGTVVAVILDCQSAPTGYSNSFCHAAPDVLAVDVATLSTANGAIIDPNSVEVTTSLGFYGGLTAFVNGGVITFATTDDFNFADQSGTFASYSVPVNYNISDVNGSVGTGTITLLIGATGYDKTITSCENIITPSDSLVHHNNGGTWSIVSQPGSITAPATWNGTVNFSAQPAGEYVLRYEVTTASGVDSCVSRMNLTIHRELSTTLGYDERATTTKMLPTASTAAPEQESLLLSTAGNCPGEAAATLGAEAIPASWGAGTFTDVWIKHMYRPANFTTQPSSLTLEVTTANYGGTAMTSPVLELYEGAVPLTDSGTNSLINTTLDFSTNHDLYIRVASLAANSGNFDIKVSYA